MSHVAVHSEPRSLNLLSICTGGGGLDLGVELAIPSARSVCLVEREAFAVAHLVEAMRQGLMAPAPVWSDARTFHGRAWRGLVDGVIGGIPCQPHSEAGKRLGAEDERDLWPPFRRTLVQSGAWWCLIENVEGMLSSGGAERVRHDLHRLGFGVEGGLFTALECGDSQERRRIFILGVADVGRSEGFASWGRLREARSIGHRPGPAGASHHLGEALGGADGGYLDGGPDQPERGPEGRTSPCRAGERFDFPPPPDDLDGWRCLLGVRPDLEPAVRRGADGLADRTDVLRLLGNGVVPLQAAYALRTLATDLARRSAGAALLVRLMGEQ